MIGDEDCVVAMSNKEERWPNFLIVGAIRAGTTSLYHYLNTHPSIYLSSIKEPGYFIQPHRADFPDKLEYLRLFDGIKNEVAFGEATTHYLGEPTSPRRIHDTIPGARIIISLRDPVERALSHWFAANHHWHRPTPPFSQAVQESARQEDRGKMPMFISLGFYSDQVQRYLDIIGPSLVKIIIFEEFIQDAQGTVDDIIKFLGIDPDHSEPITGKAHNVATRRLPKRRVFASNKMLKVSSLLPARLRAAIRQRVYTEVTKPVMEQADRKVLEDLYRADVKRLATILNRPLPWKWAEPHKKSSQ